MGILPSIAGLLQPVGKLYSHMEETGFFTSSSTDLTPQTYLGCWEYE